MYSTLKLYSNMAEVNGTVLIQVSKTRNNYIHQSLGPIALTRTDKTQVVADLLFYYFKMFFYHYSVFET